MNITELLIALTIVIIVLTGYALLKRRAEARERAAWWDQNEKAGHFE